VDDAANTLGTALVRQQIDDTRSRQSQHEDKDNDQLPEEEECTQRPQQYQYKSVAEQISNGSTLSTEPYHRIAAESHPYHVCTCSRQSTATQASRAPQQDEDEKGISKISAS
jgi:hypothetical protein